MRSAGVLLATCFFLGGCSVLEPAVSSRRQAAGSDHGLGEGISTADASQEGGPACGKITSAGCCDGETLWWCAQGALKSKNCGTLPSCGWSNSKIYDCNTSGVADPSGKHYMQCKNILGDGGVPASDSAPGVDGGGCQGIKAEGCCSGNTLKYCEDGKLKTLGCDQNPRCGWLPNGQYYDCGTAGKPDPDGKYPKACPGTTPQDLGPDQTPDGTGDAVLDMASGDGQGKDGGCSCGVGHGSSPLLLLLFVALLVRGRRSGT